MTDSARYGKLVEWSDEGQCLVGRYPGIIGPSYHGGDEAQVDAGLCQILNEWIDTLKADGKPLAQPTAGRRLEEKLLDAA